MNTISTPKFKITSFLNTIDRSQLQTVRSTSIKVSNKGQSNELSTSFRGEYNKARGNTS